MKFGWDKEAIEEFESTCLAHWRHLVDDAYMDEMERRLAHLESDIPLKCLQIHLEDLRTNARGEPGGKYPPTLADLLSHATALERRRQKEKEKIKREKERKLYEAAQKIRQESDAPYQRLVKSQAVQEQLRFSRQIRTAIEHHFLGSRQLQTKLIMGTLTELSRRGLLHEGSAQEALKIAAQLKDRIPDE